MNEPVDELSGVCVHVTVTMTVTGVPQISAGCDMTVVIPARDEEQYIVQCLEALASQANPHPFDVIVFANNCTDRTAERARACGRGGHLRLHVIEAAVATNIAHVGTARRALMDCAAARFLAVGNPLGVIATTDADTVVAGDWVERTRDEMRSVDAVAGFVEIAASDQQAMSTPMRLLYARETAFRQAWTELESLIDPLPEDPAPRHGAFVCASLAVTAATYGRAGGLPPLPTLEDREFLFALRRVDARIRYSLDVRAWTSGRSIARVTGGFGTFIGHLSNQGATGQPYLVDNPLGIIDELEGRAALRRLWHGTAAAADYGVIYEVFALTPAGVGEMIDRSTPFGTNYDRIAKLAASRRAPYAMVPVDKAIAVLRAALAARKELAPVIY